MSVLEYISSYFKFNN